VGIGRYSDRRYSIKSDREQYLHSHTIDTRNSFKALTKNTNTNPNRYRRPVQYWLSGVYAPRFRIPVRIAAFGIANAFYSWWRLHCGAESASGPIGGPDTSNTLIVKQASDAHRLIQPCRKQCPSIVFLWCCNEANSTRVITRHVPPGDIYALMSIQSILRRLPTIYQLCSPLSSSIKSRSATSLITLGLSSAHTLFWEKYSIWLS